MRDNVAMKSEPKVRAPIVSGIFYPEEKSKLQSLVQDLMQPTATDESVHSAPQGHQLRALIVPHASYRHIGTYLARAFATIRRPHQIDRVVLLSTVRRDFEDAVFIPDFTAFDCPLKSVAVDQTAINQLAEAGAPFKIDNLPHTEEHAQEVLLPMLSECCPEAEIVPLLIGNNSKNLLDKAASILSTTGFADEPNTLWVLSSNLSSFTDSVNAQKEAKQFLDQLAHPSDRLLSSRSIKACGRGGLYLMWRLFSEEISFIKLEVGRSGLIQPEQREVWYGSFAGYVPAEV